MAGRMTISLATGDGAIEVAMAAVVMVGGRGKEARWSPTETARCNADAAAAAATSQYNLGGGWCRRRM